MGRQPKLTPEVLSPYRFNRFTLDSVANMLNVPRSTCNRALRHLELAGVLEAFEVVLGSFRPVKAYQVSRDLFMPKRPVHGNFKPFLEPLVNMKEKLGLHYALAAPFASSVHGRVQAYAPWRLYLPADAFQTFYDLYGLVLGEGLLELEPLDKETLRCMHVEAGLQFLGVEDTVADCLCHVEANTVKVGNKVYSVDAMNAAAVVLRKMKVEATSVDVDHLCWRAIAWRVCKYLLMVVDALKERYKIEVLDEQQRRDLVAHAEKEKPAKSLYFDWTELDEVAHTSSRYFALSPWRTFYGW